MLPDYSRPKEPNAYYLAVSYHSSLIGSDFSHQNLSGYKLAGANMTSSDFEEADLSNVDFTDCILTNSNFRGANLERANLTKAVMIKCDFSRANLHLADFTDTDVVGSDFTGAYMKAVKFIRTDARSSHFRRVSAKNALFIGADLRKCNWLGADLLGARFDGSKVWGARGADMAIFKWWMAPLGSPPQYRPRTGWIELNTSIMGGISARENAARIPKWNKKQNDDILRRLIQWLTQIRMTRLLSIGKRTK